MVNTEVHFTTNQPLLQKLVDTAEKRCLENKKDFGGRMVLIEGGGYEKIWLETQPMGGEMYAKRDLETGRNNQLFFMENIREDGRLPGSIALIDGVVTPQFDKFQGFCFPAPALNLYYLLGKDQDYLQLLYSTLERFDAYLWRTRDSDGDGCLESWCRYDTGEDHAERYGDAPNAWEAETPPEGCEVVPMASIDVMSYSYSCRETLEKISRIMKKADWAEGWHSKALQVREKIASLLWSEEAGACLDRDRQHRVMNVLTHNTLRAMYWNSITPYMAERFVREHLLNPREFWTRMPLPSVAVNDPLFRNVSTNNWSGQAEALTYQRAIRALENYGYDNLIPLLGRKLFAAVGEGCRFVQQYDPFTGEPSLVEGKEKQDYYGPALLSVLEYISRMYGVHIEGERLYWGGVSGSECVYEQRWGEQCYRLENTGSRVVAYINGKKKFTVEAGMKVITDLEGRITEVR
ncbi:MAG: hypothetical protein NC432_09295 [Roseburia sp.]|nr:hypothetical protein [Roseburia sp.]MCM1098762.1 hypothetical protein [Ruminococcus flavefaciens]